MDWIKATPQTMPPDGQDVIVTINGKVKKHIVFGVYRKNGKWRADYEFDEDDIYVHYYSDDEVTHWMPYPEPAED